MHTSLLRPLSFVLQNSSFKIRHSSFVIRHFPSLLRPSSFVLRPSSFVLRTSSSGFTLVEVLLATMILGLGVVALFSGISSCLQIMGASKEFQHVQWVFGVGSLEHPVTEAEKPEELVVEPDNTLVDGFTFERTIDEKIIEEDVDDDGLYIMRTRVSWGNGGDGQSEEIVQYIWNKDWGEYTP